MPTYTLFGQGTVTIVGSNSSAPFTLGNEIEVSQNATLDGYWWYSPTGAANLPTQAVLYDANAGTQIPGTLITPSWSGSAGSNAWMFASFGGSYTLVPGTKYVVAIFSAGGSPWYPVTNGYWTSGAGASGIANGPLSAPSSASAVHGQSVFNSAASLAFPSSTVTGFNFWIDLQIRTASVPVSAPGYTGELHSCEHVRSPFDGR